MIKWREVGSKMWEVRNEKPKALQSYTLYPEYYAPCSMLLPQNGFENRSSKVFLFSRDTGTSKLFDNVTLPPSPSTSGN
jgi:hypothetical protein